MKRLNYFTMLLLCIVAAAGSVTLAVDYTKPSENCVGGYRWAGDIDDDCRVQFDDYASLAGSWTGQVSGPQILESYATGAAIRIEAEDCVISSATTDPNSYWSTYNPGDGTRVIVTADANGDNFMSTGAVRFSFPDAIPDGTYWLRMKWGLNSWSHYWVSYKIEHLGSGYLGENGALTKPEGHHLIWTKYGEFEPDITGEWQGTDDLAGPNGFDFYVNPDSTVGTSITVTDAGAGDLSVVIWDYSNGGYDRVEIDWFELVPIEGETLTIQAEDCIGSGMCDVNAFAEFEYFGTSGHAVIARDAGGHFTATGVGTMAFPIAIPDGEYLLRMNWAVDSWSGYYGKVGIDNLGGGTVTENGGVVDEDGYHLFYTRDVNEDYITGWSGWMNDYIAGADGMYFDDMGNTIGISLTVSGVGAGELVVSMNEPSPDGYDVFRIDKFELIPIVPLAGTLPIVVQAEDCNLSGLIGIGTLGGVDYTSIAYDADAPDHTAYATGVGYMAFPDAIPDGNYTLEMRYKANNWAETQSMAYQISTTGSGTVTEQGISSQNSWHQWIITGTGGGSTPWYLDEIAGPSSYDGTMSESGFEFTVTEPAAEYLTISGVDANELVVAINDYSTAMYNRLDVDYFKLIPYQELDGDLDNNGWFDFNDVEIFVSQWLYCNDPCDPSCDDIVCGDKPVDGVTEYTAYVPAGPVTINGDLSDWPAFDYVEDQWCTTKWVAMDKLYAGGTPYFIGTPYVCFMYDASADLIYGAVVVDDYDPWYWSCGGAYSYEQQDDIEVYIQGDLNYDTPESPFGEWFNAQQFMVGVCSDESTPFAHWPDNTEFSTVASGFEVAVDVWQDPNDSYHHKVTYEFKAVPYDSFGGFNGSKPTTQTDLYSGKKLGLDVALMNYSPTYFDWNMFCANLLTGKAYNVTRYAEVTCE